MIGRILFRIGPVCPFFRVGKCGIEKNAQSHKDGFRHLEIVVRHPMGRSAIFNLLFFILTLTFNKGKKFVRHKRKNNRHPGKNVHDRGDKCPSSHPLSD
ncbi:MAG: hypothetical protein CW346_17795 [Bacillaceae bacterium]|nr:hypothetical protein [Bacillaceae bacterium]